MEPGTLPADAGDIAPRRHAATSAPSEDCLSSFNRRPQERVLDGHRVTLDVYPAVGPVRGAAILSHGFARSRKTLAGHARALAEAGVLDAAARWLP